MVNLTHRNGKSPSNYRRESDMSRITAIDVLEHFGYQQSKDLAEHVSMLKTVMDAMSEAIHDEVSIKGCTVVLSYALDMNGCLDFSTTLASDLPQLSGENLALFTQTPGLLDLHDAVWGVVGNCKMDLDDMKEPPVLDSNIVSQIGQKAWLCQSQL